MFLHWAYTWFECENGKCDFKFTTENGRGFRTEDSCDKAFAEYYKQPKADNNSRA